MKGKYSQKAASEKRAQIFLVDDHPMLREGMGRLIDGEPGLAFSGGAGSAEQALSEIAGCKPDLVVTDLTLPGRSGLDLIKDLSAMYPDLPVLVFSMHDEAVYAERALKAGARGYMMKEAGSEKMLAAIRQVLAGEINVSPRVSAKILAGLSRHRASNATSPIEKLTDRELDVYGLIGRGKATKEIAEQLHLSHKTVAVHRANIKEKLGIGSVNELMHHAIRWVEHETGGPGTAL